MLPALGTLLIAVAGSVSAADPFTELGIDRPKVRLEAPQFTLEMLSGGKAGLSEFTGKVVLLNFWATWCIPCREEMPAMEQLWQRYREQGFVIVAIAVNRGERQQVASFVDKLALSYPVLLDPEGEARKRYEVTALPMSYFIGRDGKFSARAVGIREWDSPAADNVVTTLLEKQY